MSNSNPFTGSVTTTVTSPGTTSTGEPTSYTLTLGTGGSSTGTIGVVGNTGTVGVAGSNYTSTYTTVTDNNSYWNNLTGPIGTPTLNPQVLIDSFDPLKHNLTLLDYRLLEENWRIVFCTDELKDSCSENCKCTDSMKLIIMAQGKEVVERLMRKLPTTLTVDSRRIKLRR